MSGNQVQDDAGGGGGSGGRGVDSRVKVTNPDLLSHSRSLTPPRPTLVKVAPTVRPHIRGGEAGLHKRCWVG